MFTGLIEEIGEVGELRRSNSFQKMEVAGDLVLEDLAVGDSISIDGVCQTVVALNGNRFAVESVEETMKRTTLSALRTGDRVNLERPLKACDRLGGHMVLGHVDGVGVIRRLEAARSSWTLQVEAPTSLRRYIAAKGSIAVDGISLTVVESLREGFTVSLIPHTFEHTNLKQRKRGDRVNIEVDVVARYLERLLVREDGNGEFDLAKLKDMGYDA
jgi:riboflavin synthase